MLATSREPSDLIFFKAAGIAGILFLLTGPISQFLHPFPADDDPVAFLDAITTTGYWTVIHLMNISGATFTLIMHLGVYRAVVGPAARWFATIAVAFAIVAVGFVAAWMAIDGVAMVNIADDWLVAGGGQDTVEFSIAIAIEDVIFGFFSLGYVLWFGVPQLMMGIAVALSEPRRAWIGWIGALAGAAAIGAGITQSYTGRDFIVTDVWMPIAAATAGTWISAMSVFIWRRSHRGVAAETPAPVPTTGS